MAGVNGAIYLRLVNYAGLIALTSTRIFRLQAPETTTYPYVTFEIISQDPVRAMGTNSGLEGPRVQVDIWGESSSSMDAVAVQVKLALRDFSGTVAGVIIQRIFLKDEVDIPDEDANKGVISYHKAIDFIVWHRSYGAEFYDRDAAIWGDRDAAIWEDRP